MDTELASELTSQLARRGYRLSRTETTMVVDVLDYHAAPLLLTREELFDLGLVIVDEEGLVEPRIVDRDFRVSRVASTVRVEPLDYHVGPLTLTKGQLRQFGLEIKPPSPPSPPSPRGSSRRASSRAPRAER